MAIFQHLPGHRMKSKVVIDLTRSDRDNTMIAMILSKFHMTPLATRDRIARSY